MIAKMYQTGLYGMFYDEKKKIGMFKNGGKKLSFIKILMIRSQMHV